MHPGPELKSEAVDKPVAYVVNSVQKFNEKTD